MELQRSVCCCSCTSAKQLKPVRLQWWPGRIGEPVQDEAGEPKRDAGGEIIYTIDYEEHGEFEAEQCQVAFLSPRVLRDQDVGACMAWRVQGDAWDDATTVLKEFADEEETEDEVVTASEFLQQQMNELQCALNLCVLAPPPRMPALYLVRQCCYYCGYQYNHNLHAA